MKNLIAGLLEITVRKEGEQMLMEWLGQSDEKEPSEKVYGYLENFIKDFEEKQLVVKFDRLEYMNSSTIPLIVRFFKSLNTAEIESLITYSMESKWQSPSFRALEKFVKMLPYVTIKGNLPE